MGSTMQALIVTKDGNSQTKLSKADRPVPKIESGNVLVKIKAAALNPSDVMNAQGNFHHTTFPRIPGRDYSGVVIEGPEELKGLEVYGTSGDLLGFTRDGTHAEYCCVPTESISMKPSNLTHIQAATVGVPFTTAALALRRANVKKGETVLVIGASGAVGSAACQLAKSWGCTVLKAARRPTADVNLEKDPDMQSARSLTGGKGPDVVIDTTGMPTVMNTALSVLAQRGRLSYISAPKKGSTQFTFDMKEVYREEKIIIGCNSVLTPSSETAQDLNLMKAEFEKGALQVEGEEHFEVIDLEQAVGAYEALMSGSRKKFVIAF